MARPQKNPINPGDQFGHLTVLSDAGVNAKKKRLYLCRCVCTKEVTISQSYLVSGQTKSCGCKHGARIDFTGKQFGKWTVLKLSEFQVTGRTKWFCKCKCGKFRDVWAHSLQAKASTSCGCDIREKHILSARIKRKTISGIPLSYIRVIKWRARGREIGFDLTLEELAAQYEKQKRQCYFTGLPVVFDAINTLNKQRHTASVDRLDSNGPYTASNIVIVHKDINRMKNEFSEQSFIHYCRLVAATHSILPPSP